MYKYYDKVGKMVVKQRSNGKKFNVDIWRANCLALFTNDFTSGEGTFRELWCFFDDEKHVKNILKNNDGKLFSSYVNVVSIELNLFYPIAKKLLNIFVKNGYKVTCYYKEIEK